MVKNSANYKYFVHLYTQSQLDIIVAEIFIFNLNEMGHG